MKKELAKAEQDRALHAEQSALLRKNIAEYQVEQACGELIGKVASTMAGGLAHLARLHETEDGKKQLEVRLCSGQCIQLIHDTTHTLGRKQLPLAKPNCDNLQVARDLLGLLTAEDASHLTANQRGCLYHILETFGLRYTAQYVYGSGESDQVMTHDQIIPKSRNQTKAQLLQKTIDILKLPGKPSMPTETPKTARCKNSKT